ncbi:MAG: 30S ribosomal protein S16 [Gemmatimonadota bacterium]
MSVKIRLRRMGAKSQPSYRVVVTDSRNARDGRFIETIGFYNPRREPVELRFDEAKTLDWLRKGATPSDTARSLLKKGGVWTKFTEGGVAAPERRQATAARKERASTRRTERRTRAEAAGKRPTPMKTRTGRTATKRKREGMPPVSQPEG